ncbi:CDP-diacylglycerol--serine O-phosphatidyltransferase [Caminicella sporogenes]|uniref:CDP-diacylglycerol--serine O-phosphatidyltransferase n=1 Tax=Caminicella sporogenes TaxID=166485 RepID=UPI002540CAE6|nr:CDP-diacylglycerol--serine O-phosphatidyltransferase [Caminicella sporogenes]WIF94994.1 CDP-diacylglycerol--serine O-phosphatidyltransferase [Caminicella sporogenes]
MKYKSLIPNFFTSLNLFMGLMAIIFLFDSNYFKSSMLILIAAVLDRFDGRLARKFGASTEFGKEFDSLCDLISFGVAPALLMWNILLSKAGIIGVVVTVFFTLAGAIRLARYNITNFDGVYMGIPITLCGSFLALLCLGVNKAVNINIIMMLMIFLSYAMVSKKIRLKKR